MLYSHRPIAVKREPYRFFTAWHHFWLKKQGILADILMEFYAYLYYHYVTLQTMGKSRPKQS